MVLATNIFLRKTLQLSSKGLSKLRFGRRMEQLVSHANGYIKVPHWAKAKIDSS
jgi:hypothetical protein